MSSSPSAVARTTSPTSPIDLRIAHSPDPDDAFMWWPLLEDDGPAALDTGRYKFTAVLDDIESLNRRAESGELEITAISCAQYPRVRHHYALTACGASMGDAYGPKLVAKTPTSISKLLESRATVAVPGERTSALATLLLIAGSETLRWQAVPFDQIIDRVNQGEFAAGLVIHEGQLTFEQSGLHQVLDVGQWWWEQHQLPLPLGCNAIHRELESRHGAGTLARITRLLRSSVEHALAHREQSVAYASQFARGCSLPQADRFIEMYVNKWTLDFGPAGEHAVRSFLTALHRQGLVPNPEPIDFIAAAPNDAG